MRHFLLVSTHQQVMNKHWSLLKTHDHNEKTITSKFTKELRKLDEIKKNYDSTAFVNNLLVYDEKP